MSNNSIILFCLLNSLTAQLSDLASSLNLYVYYLKTETKQFSEMSKLTFSIYARVNQLPRLNPVYVYVLSTYERGSHSVKSEYSR